MHRSKSCKSNCEFEVMNATMRIPIYNCKNTIYYATEIKTIILLHIIWPRDPTFTVVCLHTAGSLHHATSNQGWGADCE